MSAWPGSLAFTLWMKRLRRVLRNESALLQKAESLSQLSAQNTWTLLSFWVPLNPEGQSGGNVREAPAQRIYFRSSSGLVHYIFHSIIRKLSSSDQAWISCGPALELLELILKRVLPQHEMLKPH